MGTEQPKFVTSPDIGPPQDGVASALRRLIRTMGTTSLELPPAIPELIENKPPTGRFICRVLGTKLCLPREEDFTLADSWANRQGYSGSAIYDSLARSPIGTHYPTLAVPEHFVTQRPNVHFLPPAFRQYRNSSQLSDMAAYRYILANGLDTTPITNATQATDVIRDIQDNFPANATYNDKISILADVYQNLLSNLELHRLTADSEGAVVRFSDTPEKDLNPTGHTVPEGQLPFARLLHPEINESYRGRWMTWWHRQDIDPEDNTSHNLFGRTRISTSLADLEKKHVITLDLACEMAIVAIRKDSDATMAI